MVATSLCHHYLPQSLHHAMLSDESAHSSDDGPRLRSPLFGLSYSLPPGDNFRYQYDQTNAQRATTHYAQRYDYVMPMNVQQPPHLGALHAPGSAAQTTSVAFSAPVLSAQTRMQPATSAVTTITGGAGGAGGVNVHPFPSTLRHSQNATATATATAAATAAAAAHGYNRQVDYRYMTPPEDLRQLPGEAVHDQSYPRPIGMSAIPSMQNAIPHVPSTQQSESSPPSFTSNNTINSSKPRKEISNVVIACNQCRSRKIRCDSKRPTCSNCARRSNTCVYDAVPKRRGPDKHPGTRQRRPKKRILEEPAPPPTSTKRRRTITDDRLDSKQTMAATTTATTTTTTTTNIKSDKDRLVTDSRTQALPSSSDQTADAGLVVKRESPSSAQKYETTTRPTTTTTMTTMTNPYPRLQVANPYPSANAPSSSGNNLGVHQDSRSQWNAILANYDLGSIVDAFRYLVDDASQWFSFINLDQLVGCLYDDDKRPQIQPAFIYSGMALAMLMKSSEKGHGSSGRDDAMQLFSLAKSALSASYRSGWIDIKLAGAAFIMAMFETSMHPLYDPNRLLLALRELDDIIQTGEFIQRDAADPLVKKFQAGTAPTIPETISYGRAIPKRCSCLLLPGTQSNSPVNQSLSLLLLPWDTTWTDEEMEAEECRRVCWNALAIITSYNTLCVCYGKEPNNFWLADPSNYALLFPGEVIDRVSPSFAGSPQSMLPKESVWALYCRSMLLFNFSTRLVWSSLGAEDKSELAADTVNETMSLQDSLDAHCCDPSSIIVHQTRELIQNARILAKKAFRSVIGYNDDPAKPFSSRFDTEQWLRWTKQMINQADSELSLRQDSEDKPGSMWTRRPFSVTWFSNQLAFCIRIWSYDQSLVNVLELGKTVLGVVDVLNGLWPNDYHQNQCEELRHKLIDACNSVGVVAPLPSVYHAPV
ncbi:hypothetical protein AX15_005441 [Amanita polypyramis BW_CC]|nr:hypothetical protein AX15_005441 [Amanita polypyramis BW_CC]